MATGESSRGPLVLKIDYTYPLNLTPRSSVTLWCTIDLCVMYVCIDYLFRLEFHRLLKIAAIKRVYT